MSSANGRLTAAELTTVAPGLQLACSAANAFERLVAAGKAKGWAISIVEPGGAYRSFETQYEMYRASRGDVTLALKWNLNPNSTVPLAGPGYSSHGFGTRVDLLFNGSSTLNSEQLAFCLTFGWTREFGANDPNHFKHDGVTATSPLTPKDPDMASTAGSYTYTPKTPLALSTSKWLEVPVNGIGGVTFVANYDGLVWVSVATRFRGLPYGSTAQARLEVVTVVKGKVTEVAYSDVVELQGSDGDAYPSFSDGVELHHDQRLRLVMLAQIEGVKVVRTAATVFRFQKG